MRWLEAGVPLDPPTIASRSRIEIYPEAGSARRQGATQRLTVRAKYSDGTDRDVTSLCVFLTNNDTSAKIDADGVVTAGERGEAFVMARFATFTVGSQFIVLPKGLQFTFPNVPENNYIDRLVNDKLKKLRIAPSRTLHRRSSSSAASTSTSSARCRRRRSTPSSWPNRRRTSASKLVDELLGRKEFAEMWVMKWAELLQIRSSNQVSYKTDAALLQLAARKIARNMPIERDRCRNCSAPGRHLQEPADQLLPDRNRHRSRSSENVAQVFMGMRIQCAQCHNHPFDRWTMNDYYGFAAFFTQIGRKRGDDPRERSSSIRAAAKCTHPVTKQVMKPKFLGGESPDVAGQGSPPGDGDWLASPENPVLRHEPRRTSSGRTSSGKGIIDEVDDVRVSNPAIERPELLENSARSSPSTSTTSRNSSRDICTSRTYQLSTIAERVERERHPQLRHAPIRRIRAETMLDVHLAGHGDEEQVPRPAARRPRRADRRRQRQQLLPDHFRPGDARNRLLVRSEAGADAVAVAAHAQWRCHDQTHSSGRRWFRGGSPRRRRRSRSSRKFICARWCGDQRQIETDRLRRRLAPSQTR